jgi:hypothetical protein
MWLLYEDFGIACAVITYAIVVIVYLGFVRIGIWEEV